MKSLLNDEALRQGKRDPNFVAFPLITEKQDFVNGIKNLKETRIPAKLGHPTASLCQIALAAIMVLWPGSALHATAVRDFYFAHPAQQDQHGVIAPWYQGLNGQLDWRVRIAAETMKRYPWSGAKALVDVPEYMLHNHWSIAENGAITVHEPRRNFAIPDGNFLTDADYGWRFHYVVRGLVDYYRYSGDPAAMAHLSMQVNHLLHYTLTADDYDPWPRFPISCPFKGNPYGHADPNWIQLDLSAQEGLATLKAYQVVGEKRWLEAAKHWGDLFALNCNYDPDQRPWNRYATVLPYPGDWGYGIPKRPGNPNHMTGGAAAVVEFLDELIKLGYRGRDNCIVKARDTGLRYLRDVLLPLWLKPDTWGRQFWDGEGLWQHAGPTAASVRCFMNHSALFDNWQMDSRVIMGLSINSAGYYAGGKTDTYHGAWVYPESFVCCEDSDDYAPMEMAPLYGEYGVRAGCEWAREMARRQMMITTYHCLDTGEVKDGLGGSKIVANAWFKIVHPMPLKHCLEAIAWMPEELGANRENHIVRSTSVVNGVQYGKGNITYSTFDAPAGVTDVLRLAFAPSLVKAGGEELRLRQDLAQSGYTIKTLSNGDCIAMIRHDGQEKIVVTGDDPQEEIPAGQLKYSGDWKDLRAVGLLGEQGKVTGSAGASVAYTFTGNQVRLIGRVGSDGGRAAVYVDGQKQQVGIDCWNPKNLARQTLYYRNGLSQGEHELKIVAQGDKNSRSTDRNVYVEGLQCSAAEGSAGFGSGGGPTSTQRMIFGYPDRQYTDTHGNVWLAATEWVAPGGGGWPGLIETVAENWFTHPATDPILATQDAALYRHGAHGKNFWANITVGPGKYHVILKFAERRPGTDDPLTQAVTIHINDERVVENMDIAATASRRYKAVDLVFNDIEPKNGVIEVRFSNDLDGEAMVQALEVGAGPRAAGAKPVTLRVAPPFWPFPDSQTNRALAPGAGQRGLRYDHAQPTSLGDVQATAPATFSAWVWPRALAGDQRLLSQLNGPVDQGGSLRFNNARLEVWDGKTWQALITDGLSARRWLHLAVVFTPDRQATAYLNGEQRGTASCGFDYRGVEAGLGAPSLRQHGRPLSGWMDDVRVLPRALAGDEVLRLFREGRSEPP